MNTAKNILKCSGWLLCAVFAGTAASYALTNAAAAIGVDLETYTGTR